MPSPASLRSRFILLVPHVSLPPRADWIFALRTTLVGIVALLVAYFLGLEQPQWAMMTVFIVSQPVAGMVLAKGFFRLAGTLIGAIASVLMVKVAGSEHIAYVTALAAWIGVCTKTALGHGERIGSQ